MKEIIPEKYWIEEGVVLVHKPVGPTSFDMIRQLRKLLNERRIGHAGTLDPLASGLLIVGVTRTGTRRMQYFLGLDKTYETVVAVGNSTTTGDREGDIVQQKTISPDAFSPEVLQQHVEGLVGDHEIPVPLYSAIKVDGQPLYWYARRGITPPRIPTKTMRVLSAQYLDHEHQPDRDELWLRIRLTVGSGSYIRSLGEVLGQRLGYPATLESLYRTHIAGWEDEAAFRMPK